MSVELRGNECYKRDGAAGGEDRIDVVLHQQDDSDREIAVALIPVVIPGLDQEPSETEIE